MKPHPYILFDGSFAGFLNAIQWGYEESHSRILLNPSENSDTLPLFGPVVKIETDNRKAKLLWGDLGLLGTEVQKRVYYGFLHENVKLQSEIYQYVAYLVCPDMDELKALGIQAGKKLEIAVEEVSRERRELERKLNFKLNADGLWYSEIRPKHHLLPLLSRYCRSRFPSDPWLVVDAKRQKELSTVCGRLTLTSSLQNTGSESEPFKNLQTADNAVRDENRSRTRNPAHSETRSTQNRRIQNWRTEWGQQAV